jgi:hypothetical protein
MKNIMLGMGVATLAIIAANPSFSRDTEKRNVREVVGYVQTTTTFHDRDAEFSRADTSGDGAVNFKEFQAASMFENEFEMFDMNDTNDDQLLTIEEFRAFSKWGPARTSDGSSMINYNFNKRGSSKY